LTKIRIYYSNCRPFNLFSHNDTINRNTEALLVASKEVGLEAKLGRYFFSDEDNAGKSLDIKQFINSLRRANSEYLITTLTRNSEQYKLVGSLVQIGPESHFFPLAACQQTIKLYLMS
jgi:hypothetical protein